MWESRLRRPVVPGISAALFAADLAGVEIDFVV